MNIEAFITKLNGRICDEFENINRGGCMIYAAEVAMGLQRCGIASRVVLVSYSPSNDDLDAIGLKVSDRTSPWRWRENGVRFEHVLVCTGQDLFIDSDNVYFHRGEDRERLYTMPSSRGTPRLQWFVSRGGFTAEEAMSLSLARKFWNPTFRYSHASYKLRKRIRGAFAQWARENNLEMHQALRVQRAMPKPIHIRRWAFQHVRRQLKELP